MFNVLAAIWRYVHYKLTHVNEEKWRMLSFCLTLSLLLWFLRQMNKTYTTGMKVRVSFEYDPGKYQALEPLPSSLWLNVTARGWPLALAAYGPSRAHLIIRPALEKGYWEADPIMIRKSLQPRMRQVAINFLQEPPKPYRFDSIVERKVLVEFSLDSGRRGWGHVCFRGPTKTLLRLPRFRVLPGALPDSMAFTVPTRVLFEDKWSAYLCADSVRVHVRGR